MANNDRNYDAHPELEPEVDGDLNAPTEPPPGSWADVARIMASTGDDDGFDWDQWKDEMKDRE